MYQFFDVEKVNLVINNKQSLKTTEVGGAVTSFWRNLFSIPFKVGPGATK